MVEACLRPIQYIQEFVDYSRVSIKWPEKHIDDSLVRYLQSIPVRRRCRLETLYLVNFESTAPVSSNFDLLINNNNKEKEKQRDNNGAGFQF